MINLLIKEFKINASIISFKKGKFFSSLLSILLFAFIVTISTYIYVLLYKKFKEYGAGVSFSMVYMALLSVITLLFTTVTARRIFFNPLDAAITISRPVDTFKIIVSKVMYLLFVIFLAELVILAPHYIAYGKIGLNLPFYYFSMVIGIIFHTLFDISVALFLMVVYHIIYTALKKNTIAQIIVVVLLMIGLCFAYSAVLDVFVNLLNQNMISSLFTEGSLNLLRELAQKLYPDVILSYSLLTRNYASMGQYMFITLAALIAGIVFIYLVFDYVIYFGGEFKVTSKKKTFKEKSPRKTLLNKELQLLMRNSDNLYSFTALIIIEPILTYLVLVGLNSAFNKGMFSIYAMLLPNFMESMNILVVLLFSSLISLGGINLLKSEHRTVRIMKFMPVSLNEQIFIKMAILGVTVAVTNIITLVLLFIYKIITARLFIFLLLITLIFNFSLIIFSFRSEIRNFRKGHNDNSLASLLSIVFPLIIAALNVVLGLSTKIHPFFISALNLLLVVGLGAIALTYAVKKMHADVDDLEVIN